VLSFAIIVSFVSIVEASRKHFSFAECNMCISRQPFLSIVFDCMLTNDYNDNNDDDNNDNDNNDNDDNDDVLLSPVECL
jgi:hypothetical protein